MSLKLAKINISNVLGVSELEITPDGNIIEISGRNGEGKTSIIESIKDAVGVSDYSQLLREGETKGRVVLDLGDMVIQKNYKENGETLKLEGRVMGTDTMSNIGKPASVIKSLINPNSVDPVRLLTAKPKDLLDAVLGAIPLTVNHNTLNSIIGEIPYDSKEHALVVLAKQTGRIMEERKLVNRDGKTAQITADQLQTTLPDNIPLIEELEAQINDNLIAIEGTRTAARKAGRNARGEFAGEIESLVSEIDELDKHIENLKQQLETARIELSSKSENLRNKEELRTKSGEDALDKELDKGTAYQEHNVELSKEIADLKVFENTQNMIKDWMNKVASSNKLSDAMTKQLKDIEKYKSELCSDLPIEGLSIEDGKLSMNKIPFQTLNTAARVDLVLELAKLSAGKLGLVILDNSECLSKETYKTFLEKAAETDLTFIVGRVTENDLQIK